jgi:hypothetical protein
MRPQFSAVFRNRKFTIAILGLVGLLVVGLLSVAGVALYNKMQTKPAPTPMVVPTRLPTQTAAPTATSLPTARSTATLVAAAASPTAKPAATALPTTALTQPAPTATPGTDGGVPNTGAPMLPALLAGGGFAVLLFASRSERRSTR